MINRPGSVITYVIPLVPMKFELRDPDGFYSTVFLPFLGTDFELRAWPELDEDSEGELPNPTEHQMIVARRILGLDASFLDELDDAAESYRKSVDGMVDLSKYNLGHITRENIRQHYRIHTVMIPVHESTTDVCFSIGAGCDWEIEHGMGIHVRNDQITYHGEETCSYNCNYWPCAGIAG